MSDKEKVNTSNSVDFKEQIAQYKERIDKLKKENEGLKIKNKELEQDNSLVTLSLGKNNKEKHSKIIELEQEIKDISFDNENKIDDLKQYQGGKVLEKEKKYDSELKQYKEDIERLNELNRTINHYKENQESYNVDLSLLKSENDRLQKEIETKTKELEERHLEETKKTKKAAINAIKEVRVKALTEAFKRLETMDLMKQQENDRLMKDVVDLGEEIVKLKHEKNNQKNMYVTANNELSILKNQLDIVTKKNTETYKQLNVQKNMNESLEKEIRKILKNSDEENLDIQNLYSDKLSEKEIQLLASQEDLKQKNSELKDIRAISQMILDQRSDIEIFFLESLEKVKIEIKRKKLEEKEKTKLPIIKNKIKSTQYSLATEDPYASRIKKLEEEKVDIRELNWEEKERVLRFLFFKMNRGVSPVYWRDINEEINDDNQYNEEDEQLQNEDIKNENL